MATKFTGELQEFKWSRDMLDVSLVEVEASGVLESWNQVLFNGGPFTRKRADWLIARISHLLEEWNWPDKIVDSANRNWLNGFGTWLAYIGPKELGGSCDGSSIWGFTGSGKGTPAFDPDEYGSIEGDRVQDTTILSDGCGRYVVITDKTKPGGTYRFAGWFTTHDTIANAGLDGVNLRIEIADNIGIVKTESITLDMNDWVFVEFTATFNVASTIRYFRIYVFDDAAEACVLCHFQFDCLHMVPERLIVPRNLVGDYWTDDIEYLDSFYRSAASFLEEIAKSMGGWLQEDGNGDLIWEQFTLRFPDATTVEAGTNRVQRIPKRRFSDGLDGIGYSQTSYREQATAHYTTVKVGSFGDVTLFQSGRRQPWSLEPVPLVLAANEELLLHASHTGEGGGIIARQTSHEKNISAGAFANDPVSGLTTPIPITYGRNSDILIVAGASGVTIDEMFLNGLIQNRSSFERVFLSEDVPGNQIKKERAIELEMPGQGLRTTLMKRVAKWAAEKYQRNASVVIDVEADSLGRMLEFVGVETGQMVWYKHDRGPGSFAADGLFFVEGWTMEQHVQDEGPALPILTLTLEEA